MGSFNLEIPDILKDFMDNIEQNLDEISMEAVESAESIVVDALTEECSKHNIAETDKTRGEMVASIEAVGAKRNQYGVFDYVYPMGEDSKGVRNVEKLAYLEYGTSKQPATPVMQKVVNRIEEKVYCQMEKYIKEKLGYDSR